MKTYTMQEACNALAIDNATLYRWIVRAGMYEAVKLQEDEQDKRRRVLSHSQLTQLARLHHRSLAQTSVKPDASEITELRERIDALERELSKMRTTLDRLTASRHNLAPTPQKTPRFGSQRVGSVGPVGSELPTGFVVLRVFAGEHGIAPTTALRAVDSGALPAERGKWKHGRTYATLALNEEGRSAFYRLYSEHKAFTKCEGCPHALSQNLR